MKTINLDSRKKRTLLLAGIIALPQQGQVLDISCGSGFLLGKLQQKNSHLKYYGVDHNIEVIEEAKERFPQVNFAVADVQNMPFTDQNFELITCAMSLHHYQDPQNFVLELQRLISPTGKIYLLDIIFKSRIAQFIFNLRGCGEPYYFNKFYNLAEVDTMLQNSGLTMQKVFEISKGVRLLVIEPQSAGQK